VYPGVELRLYRYVAVLAEELNFTRAAQRLHPAQPSLSKQIRNWKTTLARNVLLRHTKQIRNFAHSQCLSPSFQNLYGSFNRFNALSIQPGSHITRGLQTYQYFAKSRS
jgi:hypothetical protein